MKSFRVNYGRGIYYETDKPTAIRYFKGLGKYSKFASIERLTENGDWIPVKLVPKKK